MAIKKIILVNFKDFIKGRAKGMTLMELTVAIGIASILAGVLIVFVSNALLQRNKQAEAMGNSASMLYLTQVFNTVDQWPQVMVKSDTKALKLTDSTSAPTKETVYYELQNSIYREEYENSIQKDTVLLAKDCSTSFQLESDAAYLKDILKITITDKYGRIWTRKVSLRDCEVVGTY